MPTEATADSMRPGIVSTVAPVSATKSPCALVSCSLRQRPPTALAASMTVNSRPAERNRRAAESPASPAPITTTRSPLPGRRLRIVGRVMGTKGLGRLR